MDYSNGYETVCADYLSARDAGTVGVCLLRDWADSLEPESKILDIGCGAGLPVSRELIERLHLLFAIDASRSMIQAFRKAFPDVPSRCEAVEHSGFFGEVFDAVVSIGMVFLLTEAEQRRMLSRVGECLRPGGHFLFTAPTQLCTWQDLLTGKTSLSLGQDEYTNVLNLAGMRLVECRADEGDNNHYFVRKDETNQASQQTNIDH